MDQESQYEANLLGMKGKTIAIVYIYEGEDAAGFIHYDVWKSDVICSWLKAIQDLGCLPYIMDVRTFVFKAMNHSLPIIDYVVNLNAGNQELSTLGLVPSVCSFLSLPCIPCSTETAITGENKLFSNLITYAKGLKVPSELTMSSPQGIIRPINLGSSCGVKKGDKPHETGKCIYQEFIPGFDLTTPIMYEPLTSTLQILPSIMYYPHNKDVNWFLNAEEKETHNGYTKRIVSLQNQANINYLELAKTFSVQTFCRIDARVACDSSEEFDRIIQEPIPHERINFLEINPMPTVRDDINIHTSLKSLKKHYPTYRSFQIYRKTIPNGGMTGFILSSSILALSRAKH